MTLSGHFDLWRQHLVLIYKPLFHASLSWIHFFNLNSVEHIQVSKAFYSLLGFFYFSIFYLISRRHLGLRNGTLYLFVFLFSSLGFTQIGNLRSDFLAGLIALLFLYLIDLRPILLKSFLFLIFATMILVLITPKGIYLAALIWFYGFLRQEKNRKLHFLNFSLFMFLVLILLIVALDKFVFSFQFLNAIYAAWVHHRSALSGFNNEDGQFFVFPFLKRDFPLIALIIIVYFRSFFLSKKCWPTIILTSLVLVIIAVHRPQLPFFIGPMIGILMILMLSNLDLKKAKLTSVLAFILLCYCFTQNRKFYYHSHSQQLRAIEVVENYLAEKNFLVVDGLGLFPRYKKSMLIYLGPYDLQGLDIQYNLILKSEPDFVVYTPRLRSIEPMISKQLLSKYKSVGPGYWLRKDLSVDIDLSDIMPAFHFGFQPNERVNQL